ncbi:hypothetical protein ASPTUDRAFT_50777 [Aspergillus tubingensis CBS 134.48]|uniref:Uncharacterized protein n=1 Tax=Aspergillus tubingensis (strain CBS 134.48) TaxID=767770 RepID=A0A1L9NFA4_ASPTC|nr:hypothetical protein ASPTUDRAFT_50777 [Aspergillus tubingensis CBS 134.48]
MLVKPRKSSLENTSPIMLVSKGWSSLVSCVLITVCISPAIVAPCLAKDVQMPLNPHGGSILRWKDCGEANNHTLQWFPTGCSHGSF